MIDMPDALISGGVVGACTSVVQWLLNRKTESKILALQDRTKKLEDEKITKLEARDDALAAKIEDSISYGVEGRREIHKIIRDDMISKELFFASIGTVNAGIARVEETIKGALLEAKQASRDVARLEGKMEGGGHGK